MKIFFDFEFIEDGAAFVMEPISIGMVREDGKEYYAEFDSVDWSKANSFVLEHVKPHLMLNAASLKSKQEIANDIVKFVGDKPEFWAYFADYDWVLLCQLYGPMVSIPTGWPYYCLDLKQYMYHTGITKSDLKDKVKNQVEHHALSDAIWNKNVYDWMREEGLSLVH